MAIKNEKDLSENARSLWLKAVAAMEMRNYGYVCSLLQAVLKETPEFLEGRKILRKAQIAQTKGKRGGLFGFSTAALKGNQLLKKDPQAALEHAEKALESDPLNAQTNYLLKEAALLLGYYETAVFALETIAEGAPKETKALHELGELYMAHGDTDAALATYNKILEIAPSDLIANKRAKDAAAASTMRKGGWETAVDYRDLIKNKDEAIALEQKNRVVKSDESIDSLIAELNQEVQANPENVDASRRIANLYEQKEDLENAIAWYQYASDLSKGTDNWLLRKVGDLRLKQTEAAIATREEWLAAAGEAHEESPRVRQELENLRRQITEMQLEEARLSVQRNPTDLLFRYELGEQLIKAGQFNEAIPELQQARRNPNVRIKAMNLLGQCYAGKGMLDLAVKQFGEAVSELSEMDATKKEMLYKLGLLYEKMGDKTKALDCLKQIYEVDYTYEDVARRVESSYSAA